MRLTIAAVCLAALLTLSSRSAIAHEGHDHGTPAVPAAGNTAPRAEAASDTYELVAVVEGTELALYVDDFITNKPVEGATVEVETPSGSAVATPNPGAAYRLAAPWLTPGSRHSLIVTVTADGAVDVLPVTLEIPPAPASDRVGTISTISAGSPRLLAVALLAGIIVGAALMAIARRRGRPAAVALLPIALWLAFAATAWAHEEPSSDTFTHPPAERAQRLPDGTVFVPKSVQRILALRTERASEGKFARIVELPGRIIPDPNASGLVQAAVGGRLSPPPGGFPKLGTRVARDQLLAYVTPPVQAVDASDMRQRQGELDQQIAITERRVTRYESLAPGGAVSRVQLDEARLELQGLKDRRAAIERAQRAPEALVAPVDGIIAEGTVVAGQIAPSNMVVFHIVDPAHLWIEALGFHAFVQGRKATARTAEGRSLALTYQGSGFAGRNQSVPIHFSVDGNTSGLRVGQFVLVLAETGEDETGIAVPRNSVVRNANGQDIVFEHVSAERFMPRVVRIAPLDSERILIVKGVSVGARVVTQGAELLDQVR